MSGRGPGSAGRPGCRPPARGRSWTALTTALALLGLALSGAGGAGAGEPVLIDAPGLWTLARLGSGSVAVPVEGEQERVTLGYRLADGAAQGPSTWYLIQLHFAVTIGEDSGDGLLYVSASTNDRAAAQVKFAVAADGGRLTTTWSSVSLARRRSGPSSCATPTTSSWQACSRATAR